MTRTEQDALFIKAQKKRITKAIGQLSEIVMNQNFNENSNLKYALDFNISMHMQGFSLRVSGHKSCESIEYVDHYNCEYIFEEHYFGMLKKRETEIKVNAVIEKINKCKKIALKYINLNNQ